ncbi:MAG: fumarate hydratase [Clostridiales bacterium]|nr:fumarate hydratase [Clostridiales bacterium]
MRQIDIKLVENAIYELCSDLCINMPADTLMLLENALNNEVTEHGKNNLKIALDNAKIAKEMQIPICQDTGMVTVFASIGQDVHFTGGSFTDAINNGVRKAYIPFRKSVLSPLDRVNTGDNTPAVIHVSLVEGDKVKLTVAPKGFGSENMSALKMLKPSESVEGVKDFIIKTVKKAGSNPCPPVIVGVGIGGTMEKAALMAKHSLAVSKRSEDDQIYNLEQELLDKINDLGIGPQGMGGRCTCLNVFIETYPTHIAGLPVAVNIQCHCARHGEVEI